MRSFAGVMRRTPIHIVHSFWLGECSFLGEGLSRLYALPHIVTFMGQEIALPNRYAGLLQSKRATFVAVSPFQRLELLKRTGREPHHVIPWGLDALASEPAAARDIDVLGVGSLTDVKDFNTFLDVVAGLRASRPNLSCRIAGDGPLRAALEARARDLGLGASVKFEGRISRECVFDLMRRSKVLLHTSTFESFGLVFAEALACGARIVSRPVGIAEPGATWALCGNPAEMVLALNRVLREGGFTPQPLFPIESTVNAYYDLYRAASGLTVPERGA
jgi:glycosyltransferase involved in cell wall biosynthesis